MKARYDIKYIGDEKQPVVIIDDFFSRPDHLIAEARASRFEPRGKFYPGIRAQGNVNYLAERMDLLTQILKEIFGVKSGLRVIECNYSLVTTRPDNLMPIQCLPHFDGLDTGRFALLHYLSDQSKGGTAFYKHIKTGYETITANRYERYKKTLEDEAAELGLPAKQYFNKSSDQFEQLLKIDAQPNRMIIYRSITLHSGFIPEGFDFSLDPELGRLTLNTFLQDKSPNQVE